MYSQGCHGCFLNCDLISASELWQVGIFSFFFNLIVLLLLLFIHREIHLEKLSCGVKITGLLSDLDQGLSDPKAHAFQNLTRGFSASPRKGTR